MQLLIKKKSVYSTEGKQVTGWANGTVNDESYGIINEISLGDDITSWCLCLWNSINCLYIVVSGHLWQTMVQKNTIQVFRFSLDYTACVSFTIISNITRVYYWYTVDMH
jgi:hypothetical protein